MQVVFSSPWAPSSLLWLAQTLHTDCRSFTLCQAKARLDVGGPAALCHTGPAEVSAGHSQGDLVGYLFAISEDFFICVLVFLPSTDTCVITLPIWGWTLTVSFFFLITMFQSFYFLVSLFFFFFICWSVTHLLLRASEKPLWPTRLGALSHLGSMRAL